ncbi:hypothetical protein Syun_005318 [Stephania yunnanensis]|uniref:Peptide methionine sulfoxide reductase A5 n=1 Tax=Stephania yunnanensis TaxID=152371 RepID=A0AAP0L501_9MAGN
MMPARQASQSEAMKKKKRSQRDLVVQILLFALLCSLMADAAIAIRFPDPVSPRSDDAPSNRPLKTAVFALGCFWRSEAVFGCLNGVVRTSAVYAGGSKLNPEFRSLGDHAEAVQIEYDPKLINFRQLLDVFWSSHDSRQVFGQGPDVGQQYRSIIFTNGTEEARLASLSKEREQTRSRSSIVTTQIQQLGAFYPAEPEHQVAFLVGFSCSLLTVQRRTSSIHLWMVGAILLVSFTAAFCPPSPQTLIQSKFSKRVAIRWAVLINIQ